MAVCNRDRHCKNCHLGRCRPSKRNRLLLGLNNYCQHNRRPQVLGIHQPRYCRRHRCNFHRSALVLPNLCVSFRAIRRSSRHLGFRRPHFVPLAEGPPRRRGENDGMTDTSREAFRSTSSGSGSIPTPTSSAMRNRIPRVVHRSDPMNLLPEC